MCMYEDFLQHTSTSDKNCNATPKMHSKLTLALKIYSSRCKAYYSIGHKTQDTTNSIIMHTVINSVFIYQSLSQHGQRTYDFLCNLNLCFFLPVNNLARTFRGPNFTELSKTTNNTFRISFRKYQWLIKWKEPTAYLKMKVKKNLWWNMNEYNTE